MSAGVAIDLAIIFLTILVLVPIANRVQIPYPIALVLGGIAIGYIPGIPSLPVPPDLVLVVFLPPLLYWESVNAPSSEFFSRFGQWWIFELAFGLVIVTTLAVGAVAHRVLGLMAWAPAFVLGAIVSSTDEVAFGPIVERVSIPRHVLATIEGESLVNDATSLVLYAIGITAIVTGTFSVAHALGELVLSVVGAVAIGLAAAFFSITAWRLIKNDSLQALISLMTPFIAYLPAYYFKVSAVLAVVTVGLTVSRYTPIVLAPRTRARTTGFWATIVFLLNAVIFVFVGLRFHSILAALHQQFSPWQLIEYALAISLTVIIVRLLWVFAQALLPATNAPEHRDGKPDWSHVTVLAWSGMRGGISLAAALAIPFEVASRPFPDRDLIIFLTFCVLLATLVVQGGTLPLILRWLNVRDDGADRREERLALAYTAKAALKCLDDLSRHGSAPPQIIDSLRNRFRRRWREFSREDQAAGSTAKDAAQYRDVLSQALSAQRNALLELRREGKVDNTVMRRVQRLLDLEDEEIDIWETTGHTRTGADG